MTTMETTATEYRDLPVSLLFESTTNPRRHFDEAFLKELADSIRANGILSPLLVRPKGERFEIVFGAQRFRSAQIAEAATVPVGIRDMTDAQVLEAQLVENLQRRDVHPMEEAQGFKALLDLEEPKYSIEQIAAKTGKSPAYITTRLKLAELIEAVSEAFWRDEIGVGHALLLAKLPANRQGEALEACFQEDWSATRDRKGKRFLLPVRNLQTWIEQHVLLILKDAPFDKRDAELLPSAGSCTDCPKRTGHNKLLFSDLSKQDACTDGVCFQAKVDAHVAKAVAAKPGLVQISTSYTKPQEGSPVLVRRQYVAIRDEKPKTKEDAQRPEFKTCQYTTEAIVAEGEGKGTTHKVCSNPDCPVHHPKQPKARADASQRAEHEKQRREAAMAQATGLRVLKAIGAAVPARLMKRDLLFVVERLSATLDERRLAIVARQHGLGKPKDGDSLAKLVAGYLRRAEESALGRLLVELVILQSVHSQTESAKVLRDAATLYKVDIEAITAQVRQELAGKNKTKDAKKSPAKPQLKQVKKAAA